MIFFKKNLKFFIFFLIGIIFLLFIGIGNSQINAAQTPSRSSGYSAFTTTTNEGPYEITESDRVSRKNSNSDIFEIFTGKRRLAVEFGDLLPAHKWTEDSESEWENEYDSIGMKISRDIHSVYFRIKRHKLESKIKYEYSNGYSRAKVFGNAQGWSLEYSDLTTIIDPNQQTNFIYTSGDYPANQFNNSLWNSQGDDFLTEYDLKKLGAMLAGAKATSHDSILLTNSLHHSYDELAIKDDILPPDVEELFTIIERVFAEKDLAKKVYLSSSIVEGSAPNELAVGVRIKGFNTINRHISDAYFQVIKKNNQNFEDIRYLVKEVDASEWTSEKVSSNNYGSFITKPGVRHDELTDAQLKTNLISAFRKPFGITGSAFFPQHSSLSHGYLLYNQIKNAFAEKPITLDAFPNSAELASRIYDPTFNELLEMEFNLEVGSDETITITFGQLLQSEQGELKDIGVKISGVNGTQYYRISRKIEAGVIKYKIFTGTSTSDLYQDLTTTIDLLNRQLIITSNLINRKTYHSNPSIESRHSPSRPSPDANPSPGGWRTWETNSFLAAIGSMIAGSNEPQSQASQIIVDPSDLRIWDLKNFWLIVEQGFAKRDLQELIEFSPFLIESQITSNPEIKAIGLKIKASGATGSTDKYYQILQKTLSSGVVEYTVRNTVIPNSETGWVPDPLESAPGNFANNNMRYVIEKIAKVRTINLFKNALGSDANNNSATFSHRDFLWEMIIDKFLTATTKFLNVQSLRTEFGLLESSSSDNSIISIGVKLTDSENPFAPTYFRISRTIENNEFKYKIFTAPAQGVDFQDSTSSFDLDSATLITKHSDISDSVGTIDENTPVALTFVTQNDPGFKIAIASLIANSGVLDSSEIVRLTNDIVVNWWKSAEAFFARSDLRQVEFSEELLLSKNPAEIALGLKLTSLISGEVEYFQIIKHGARYINANNEQIDATSYTVINAEESNWNSETIIDWTHPGSWNEKLLSLSELDNIDKFKPLLSQIFDSSSIEIVSLNLINSFLQKINENFANKQQDITTTRIPRQDDFLEYQFRWISDTERFHIIFSGLLPTPGALTSMGVQIIKKDATDTTVASAFYRVVTKLENNQIKYQILTGTAAGSPYTDLTSPVDLTEEEVTFRLISKADGINNELGVSDSDTPVPDGFVLPDDPTFSIALASMLAGEQGDVDKALATAAHLSSSNIDILKTKIIELLVTGQIASTVSFSKTLLESSSPNSNNVLGMKIIPIQPSDSSSATTKYFQIMKEGNGADVKYAIINANKFSWNQKNAEFSSGIQSFQAISGNLDFLIQSEFEAKLSKLLIKTYSSSMIEANVPTGINSALFVEINSKFTNLPHYQPPEFTIKTTAQPWLISYSLTIVGGLESVTVSFGELLDSVETASPLKDIGMKITKTTPDSDTESSAYYRISRSIDSATNKIVYKIWSGLADGQSYQDLTTTTDSLGRLINSHPNLSQLLLSPGDKTATIAPIDFANWDSIQFHFALASVLAGQQAETNQKLVSPAEISTEDVEQLFKLIEICFSYRDINDWVLFADEFLETKFEGELALGMNLNSISSIDEVDFSDQFQIIKQTIGTESYTIIDAENTEDRTYSGAVVNTFSINDIDSDSSFSLFKSMFTTFLGENANRETITDHHIFYLRNKIAIAFGEDQFIFDQRPDVLPELRELSSNVYELTSVEDAKLEIAFSQPSAPPTDSNVETLTSFEIKMSRHSDTEDPDSVISAYYGVARKVVNGRFKYKFYVNVAPESETYGDYIPPLIFETPLLTQSSELTNKTLSWHPQLLLKTIHFTEVVPSDWFFAEDEQIKLLVASMLAGEQGTHDVELLFASNLRIWDINPVWKLMQEIFANFDISAWVSVNAEEAEISNDQAKILVTFNVPDLSETTVRLLIVRHGYQDSSITYTIALVNEDGNTEPISTNSISEFTVDSLTAKATMIKLNDLLVSAIDPASSEYSNQLTSSFSSQQHASLHATLLSNIITNSFTTIPFAVAPPDTTTPLDTAASSSGSRTMLIILIIGLIGLISMASFLGFRYYRKLKLKQKNNNF